MKIVVLDSDPAFGSAAAPFAPTPPEQSEGRSPSEGMLDISALTRLGDVEIHPLTKPGDVVARARDAQVILTNKVALGENEFASLPALKLVSVLATGVNVIDTQAARVRGITVCNVPGYSTMSTAQHAFALLLELTNHVGAHSVDVANGGWENAPTFSYFRTQLHELDGKVMGVVGFGAIGRQVARIAQAFGMRVIVHTRSKQAAPGVDFVEKDVLLRQSDAISLHIPLTDETKHFIDEEALSLMKPSAFVINAARGPIVDEQALSRALSAGTIAGAATDVLTEEPPQANCPLLTAPRCLITPHIAWATEAARRRLLAATVENIEAFQKGTPQNVVTAP